MEGVLADLPEAVEILRRSQDFPSLALSQLRMIEFMVRQHNSAHQLPTGVGKTYGPICLPSILDLLRDSFGHDFIPKETRTLYVVPLINIFDSLSSQMDRLKISHQIIEAGSSTDIDEHVKVVCISPEKLLNPVMMKNILKLNWSIVSVDEPHLAIEWGTSKGRKKPFRKAMLELSKLNSVGTAFECHSATINSFEQIFSFLGRRNSIWKTQIESPNRPNLTFYLLKGSEAPDNILQLPFVKNVLTCDYDGILLIYVQRITDGNQIFFSLLDFCEKQGLIKYSVQAQVPHKPFAFLHAKLSEESKKGILSDASRKMIKVLIATSSAGCGVNLPITKFLGWGLDPQPSGIIQASGRTARKPLFAEGPVVWVHKANVHGRRVPVESRVRDLLKAEGCLRQVQNAWFNHGRSEISDMNPCADLCCSNCMKLCVSTTGCEKCSSKLELFAREDAVTTSTASKELADFLVTLNLNDLRDEGSNLNEKNLATEILLQLSETKDMGEIREFLSIFSFSETQTEKLVQYLEKGLVGMLSRDEVLNLAPHETSLDPSCTSDSDMDEDTAAEDEYYDSDDKESQ